MKTDLEIQQDVLNQIKWEPQITAANIGVAVKNGIVTLSGEVDTYAQKISAEIAAKKVSGVKAVAEDIRIGASPNYKRTDVDIAGSVVTALKWHSAVPEESIKVKVEDGVVTLEGEVDWEYQRQSARHAVETLLGVRSVINLVSLRARTTSADVQNKIRSAFHRSATIDADKIDISISGTKVVLRGTVRSHAEKEDAEEAAWCAPGINRVESYLQVEPQEILSF
ncbi:MAG: BON domain-containing protein [Flavisolibacter sp.]